MSPYIYAGLAQQQYPPRSLAHIVAVVAAHYDLLPSRLATDSRQHPVAVARHLVLYLCHLTQPTLAYTLLGKRCFLKAKSGKAVKYAITTIENQLRYDHAFALHVNTLIKTLHIKI